MRYISQIRGFILFKQKVRLLVDILHFMFLIFVKKRAHNIKYVYKMETFPNYSKLCF